jgi:aspartyl protease family protein
LDTSFDCITSYMLGFKPIGKLKGLATKNMLDERLLGYVRVKTVIANLADKSKRIDVDCLVDTGAIYTLIPRDLLEKVGTRATGARRFKLANGKVEEYSVGEAYVEVQGIGATSLLVFGPEESQPLLGVTTLELLGLQVDPVSGQLKPLELYLL